MCERSIDRILYRSKLEDISHAHYGDIEKPEDFFEGTEKLLEVWFAQSNVADSSNQANLRTIDKCHWDKLLELAKCEIISVTGNDSVDAYILSESSMFVSHRRFILKTCGTTTLLLTINPLLKLVQQHTSFDLVEDVFYSHKEWMEPSLQHRLHHSFDDEVAYLNTMFENGGSYVLGTPPDDCWYLYTLDHHPNKEPDQTLEVLMTDLDPNVMKLFYSDGNTSAHQITKLCGIDRLLEGATIDDALFQPCGYSMNGILDNAGYFTIHITPEDGYSYVSFETNVSQSCFHGLISKVISIFKPGKFLITLFANENSCVRANTSSRASYSFPPYLCLNVESKHFVNYQLSCLHFGRSPS